MLLSNTAPVMSEWLSFFVPLFSGIADVIILITMLILMRLTYNALSRLLTHMVGI